MVTFTLCDAGNSFAVTLDSDKEDERVNYGDYSQHQRDKVAAVANLWSKDRCDNYCNGGKEGECHREEGLKQNLTGWKLKLPERGEQ